jgi:hypothetical protein
MGVDEDRDESSLEPGLTELVALERRIEEELAEAGAEVERIVAAARVDVRRRKEESEADLATALGALRDRMRNECEESLRAIDARAEAQLASFEGVDDVHVAALGRFVAERLGGGGAAG